MPSSKVFVPGGFWVRFLALIIDALIVSVVMSIILGLRYGRIPDKSEISGYSLLQILITGLYAGAFYSITGATLGKKVFSLRVVDYRTGQRLGFWRGMFRDMIGKTVSALSLGIGFLVAAFNKDKRSLHDYIFDTRVIKETETLDFLPESSDRDQLPP